MSSNVMPVTLDDADTNFKLPNNSDLISGTLSLGETVIRKCLIYSAVNFINNPRILGTPKDQKTVFLLKKGLTQDEIDLAFDLCITRPSNDVSLKRELDFLSSLSLGSPINSSNNNLLNRLFNLVYSVIVLGGFAYGAFTLYQTKVRPYFDSTLSEEMKDPYQEIQNQITEINDKVAQLRNDLTTINNFISTYCSTSQDSLALIIKEVKSTKSLLVNQNQFPMTPSIPKWQFKNGDADSKSVKVNGEQNACNGHVNSANIITDN